MKHDQNETMSRTHSKRQSAMKRLGPVIGLLSLGALAACGGSSGGGGSLITGKDGHGGKGGNNGGGGGGGTGGADASAPSTGGVTSFGAGGSTTDSGLTRGPDGSCGQQAVSATTKQVNVLLVIDKSGSMSDTPQGFTTDKWSALTTALTSALSAVKNDLSFGMELFPAVQGTCKTNCCDLPAAPGIAVPIESGATGVPKIIAALKATAPGGGTPTAAALERALDYFKTGAGASLPGDRYVLLATDGGPDCNSKLTCGASQCTTNLDGQCPLPDAGNHNCCDPAFAGGAYCLDETGTKDAIQALKDAGVKTFVVGIPGTEAYATSLDTFAETGGEVSPSAPPKYFAVSESAGVSGLTDVLTSITRTLITSCRLRLAEEPPAKDRLNVYVDGKEIPASGADGWTLDETTSPPTVVLLGKTCAAVESTGAQSVRIVYGCPTVF
jgi:hypothetical protein